MILYAQALAISNVGYDQDQRWTFLDKKNRRIVRNKECDCSSSCGAIAWLAGYPVDIHGTFYSGNFAAKMKAAHFTIIAFEKLSQVKAGDFVVGPGHVVFDAGSNGWWSANQDENGHKAGGKAGDQGRECIFRAPYLRDKGWVSIVRPT